MKIRNFHKREIAQPKSEIAKLFNTLASEHDMILATDKWSAMKLDKGLQVGSKGGHGPIRYFVTDYQPGNAVTFQFDLRGFDGFHRFEIAESGPGSTALNHLIEMETSGAATLKWLLIIRWLHDAYIEDAFDKVENNYVTHKKISKWSWWVRILRGLMKTRNN